MFSDRNEAGHQLAQRLAEEDVTADLVLAVSPNDVPVAQVVAAQLELPLDILSVARIKAPFNEDVSLGAITDAGSAWLNRELIAELGIDNTYTEGGLRVEQENAAKQRSEHYGSSPDLTDKDVLIVTDGMTDGAHVQAGITHAQEHEARSVILATPFLPEEQVNTIQTRVDQLVFLEALDTLWSVASQYETYDELTPHDAATTLRQQKPGA